MADIVLDFATKIRNKPVSAGFLRSLKTALEATDPRVGARIVSGGQPPKGKGGRRTGSTRHDVDSTGHAHAGDLVLTIDGRDVRPSENKALYARFLSNAAPFFPGIGHYPWGVHVGAGKTAAWGPTLSKRSLDPVFGRAIRSGRTGRKPKEIAEGAVPQAMALLAPGSVLPRPKPNKRGIKPLEAAQPPLSVVQFANNAERDLAVATPVIEPAGGGAPGNAPIDLSRPRLSNPDGSFSTERTITIDQETPQGRRWFNIPTIVNGQELSEDQATALFRSGQNPAVGEFNTLDEALQSAQARSNRIGELRTAPSGVDQTQFGVDPVPAFDPAAFGAVLVEDPAAVDATPATAEVADGPATPTIVPGAATTGPAQVPDADAASIPAASGTTSFNPLDFGAVLLDEPPPVATASAAEIPQAGVGESLTMGGVQGVTLGFADEIFAGLESARLKLSGDERSFGELFDLHQRAGSAEFQRAREANPKTFLGGEIAGALGTGAALTPVGLVARTAGRSLAARIGAGAVEGTGFGAVTGAGTTEGGLAERAVGAGEGALVGAALGGALPVVGTAVGAGVRAAGRQVAGPAGSATTLIADRLKNANTSIQRALTRLNKVQKTAPDATLADVGGPEVQQLLRAASNVPSEARSSLFRKLANRKQFQFKRLADAFGVASGGSTDEFFETVAGLGRIRKDAAKPLFDQAFARPVPFTKKLEEVLNRPIVRAAIPRARAAAQNRGEDFEGVFAREVGRDADGIPTFDFTAVPGTRDLHRIKQELDKIIGGLRRGRETNLTGTEIRDVTIAKKALLDAIENQIYKKALAKYAGDSAMINAAEEGLDILKKRPDEIKAFMNGLGSEAEKQLFRMGAARGFVDQIRNRSINRDAVSPVLENAQNIERIKAIFPNSTRRGIQRVQAIENLQTRTLRAVQGNSTTARQLLESQRASGIGPADALAVGADVLTGGAAGATAANAARRGLGSVIGERLQGLRPDVADEVIRQLTSASGETITNVAQRLQQLTQQQQRALTLTDLAILGLTPATIAARDGLPVP